MHITSSPVLPEDTYAIVNIEDCAGEDNPAGPLMFPGLKPGSSTPEESKKARIDSAAATICEILTSLKDLYMKAVDEDEEETVENLWTPKEGEVQNEQAGVPKIREAQGTGKGKIVAFAWWQMCKGKTEEEWAKFYAGRHRPPHCNAALMDAMGGARTLRRAKLLGDRDYYSKSFPCPPCPLRY